MTEAMRRMESRIADSVDASLAHMASRAQASDHFKRLWKKAEAEVSRLADMLDDRNRQIDELNEANTALAEENAQLLAAVSRKRLVLA